MAGAEIICPGCGAKSHSTREIPAGARVKCPQCAHIFAYGGAEAGATEEPSRVSAAPRSDPAPRADDASATSHVSETPRVEPAESGAKPTANERGDAKATEQRRPARRDRDDEDDRPRSRRSSADDRDHRPLKRKKRRSKGPRGNLLAAIGVLCVIFIMMLGVGGTVLGFALFGGKPPPTPPTVAGRFQASRGNSATGWMEDDDPANLQSPSDEGSADSAPLNANLTSIFQDAPYGSGRPRPLVGPLPLQPDAKPGAANRGAGIPPEILAKVKQATTYIVVPIGENQRASGSGFFVGQNLIATNAHVVGMLVPGSEAPKSIQVIIRQGQPDEAACSGKLLAWDSENDLALIQVKTADKSVKFPAPLEIVGAPGLFETQSVYVVGYPLGEQIGKAVTVAETTISSLRQDATGRFERVQVNGGMQHGNSGGPVVNAAGQVVGVSVAIVEGTTINWAVPAERVSDFLDGKLLTLECGELAHAAKAYSVPITVRTSDPLEKFQSVAIDWWLGGANEKVPAGRQPPPKAANRQSLPLKRERAGAYTATVPLGTELADGKVLWLQAHQRDKEGREIYYQGLPVQLLPPAEAKPVQLVYRPRKEAPKVAIQTQLTERFGGEIGLHSVEYSASSRLREKRLGQDASKGWNLRCALDSLDVRESIDRQSLDRVRSIDEYKLYLAKSSIRVQANSSGQITEARPAFKDMPSDSREALTKYIELIARSLQFASVSFPEGEIEPKHTWESQFSLALPSLQNRIIFPVEIKYTYVGLRTIDGRQVAELSLSGEVAEAEAETPRGGGNSAGFNIVDKSKTNVGKVGGYAFVDVKTGIVSRMSIYADSAMSGEFHAQQVSGRSIDLKLAGMIEVKLQRQ